MVHVYLSKCQHSGNFESRCSWGRNKCVKLSKKLFVLIRMQKWVLLKSIGGGRCFVWHYVHTMTWIYAGTLEESKQITRASTHRNSSLLAKYQKPDIQKLSAFFKHVRHFFKHVRQIFKQVRQIFKQVRQTFKQVRHFFKLFKMFKNGGHQKV